MKKKILALTLVVVLAATAVIGGTLAYFTDTDKADNVFTVGNVDITLHEPDWAGNVDDHDDFYPGEAIAKDPCVTNDGENPCFVRIKVTGWDCLGEGNMIQYRTNGVINALGEGWHDVGGGVFYYDKILAVGEQTTDLFDHIVIPTTVTNGFDGTYDLVVTAEAVQAQGARASWSEVQKMSIVDIDAWFQECGM